MTFDRFQVPKGSQTPLKMFECHSFYAAGLQRAMATIVAPGVRKRWADIEDSQEDSQPAPGPLIHQEPVEDLDLGGDLDFYDI